MCWKLGRPPTEPAYRIGDGGIIGLGGKIDPGGKAFMLALILVGSLGWIGSVGWIGSCGMNTQTKGRAIAPIASDEVSSRCCRLPTTAARMITLKAASPTPPTTQGPAPTVVCVGI